MQMVMNGVLAKAMVVSKMMSVLRPRCYHIWVPFNKVALDKGCPCQGQGSFIDGLLSSRSAMIVVSKWGFLTPPHPHPLICQPWPLTNLKPTISPPKCASLGQGGFIHGLLSTRCVLMKRVPSTRYMVMKGVLAKAKVVP